MTDTLYGKLKPCPFCGAPAEMDTRRAYRDMATRRDDDVIVGSGGSTQKVPVEGSAFADILLQKIEEEILDTEGALISSRDAGRWTQHQTLQGHKAGLLWVRNRIKEMLP